VLIFLFPLDEVTEVSRFVLYSVICRTCCFMQHGQLIDAAVNCFSYTFVYRSGNKWRARRRTTLAATNRVLFVSINHTLDSPHPDPIITLAASPRFTLTSLNRHIDSRNAYKRQLTECCRKLYVS